MSLALDQKRGFTLKVTFDSNVWRIVTSPDSFPKEPSISSFRKINGAVGSGEVLGRLAETVFTLEAVKKSGRQAFLACYKPVISTAANEQADGMINLSFSIGPDRSAHLGNTHYLSKHWKDAEQMGFKILHCPRIATPINSDLREEWFVGTTHEIAKRFGDCGREIESRGCGIAQIKAIGTKYAGNSQPWYEGISIAPMSEETAIGKAVAEWADGDTVAAHYAYTNDYLCTRDTAKSGGADSVFSAENRAWLESKYGIKFITPEALANMI